MTISRRHFLKLMGAAAVAAPFGSFDGDWTAETPLVRQIRLNCEAILGGMSMALDFRAFDPDLNEHFRIQIRANQLMPVASCFKAFVGFYYYLNTPQADWRDDEFTALYRMVVHSDNGATGVVLADVARRVEGPGNPIEKFNDFQRRVMGMTSGLHSWNWPGSPTVDFFDPRFAPSNERTVWVRGLPYPMDNVCTAADLARGYDFITRGEHFSSDERFRAACRAVRALLSIPSYTFYRSPIERAFPAGYTGKDGVLPTDDFPAGRVINDAGTIQMARHTYLLAFLSAGESESVALDVVRALVDQMTLYESETA